MTDSNFMALVPVTGGGKSHVEVLIPLRGDVDLQKSDDLADLFSASTESNHTFWRDHLTTLGAASSAVREALSHPDGIYRLVEGGVTPVEGSKGLVRGAQWCSGAEGKGMKQMALFKEAGRTAALASTFFSQSMMIYIAYELNDIKKGIEDIKSEMFNAEVSRMKGCVRFAGTVLRHYRRNGDKVLLFNAVQSLETEVDPLLDAIIRKTRQLPTDTKFMKVSDSDLERSFYEIRSAVVWLLKGMVALSIVYSVTDADFGKGELLHLLKDFSEGNRAIIDWLEHAGHSLSLKGGDTGYVVKENIVRMKENVQKQIKVLEAPRVGLLLTGRQLAALGQGVGTKSVPV